MNHQITRSSNAIARPAPSEQGMPIQILDWRPVVKNTLRGFCRIQIGRALIIHDCVISSKAGSAWASLPSKPMVGRDSEPMRDDAGKPRYAAVLEWSNSATRQRFSESVISALIAAYPNALDGEP